MKIDSCIIGIRVLEKTQTQTKNTILKTIPLHFAFLILNQNLSNYYSQQNIIKSKVEKHKTHTYS